MICLLPDWVAQSCRSEQRTGWVGRWDFGLLPCLRTIVLGTLFSRPWSLKMLLIVFGSLHPPAERTDRQRASTQRHVGRS